MSPTPYQNQNEIPSITPDDDLSDYGSDFTAEEEAILISLVSALPVDPKPKPTPEPTHDAPRTRPLSPHVRPDSQRTKQPYPALPDLDSPKIEISLEHEEAFGFDTTLKSNESRSLRESSETPISEREGSVSDTRTPLSRFRGGPRKTLSVTDLISPSWCELQYFFSLSKHGRIRPTPAMKAGTIVHKTLEEETLGPTVPIAVTTREDSWGLRLWNVIQGLSILRETGQTREIGLWGVIEGVVVNGFMDELSYTCPDRELELEAEAEEEDATIQDPKSALEADQRPITDFLATGSTPPPLRIYITDVKTTARSSLPSGASFRPTIMQLMLYHRLLSDLADHAVDPSLIWARFELNPDRPFSDDFVAQIGALSEGQEYFDVPRESPHADPDQPNGTPIKRDSLDLILRHNSLRSLWNLLAQHIQLTFPSGRRSIGDVLKVEYRTPDTGDILGVKTFLHDDRVLEPYLADEMRWWRGERPPRGVVEEEAYKCARCEFADNCDWRKEKVRGASERFRKQRRSVV